MSYFFTSESVSEGHPDKIADQISDYILDHLLAFDPQSRVAIETLVTTGQVILAGEVTTQSCIDLQTITRHLIQEIGYTKEQYRFHANSCGILSAIHKQSSDIIKGINKSDKENQGAGDQGIMFGYAINETDNYMPLSFELCNTFLKELSAIRKEAKSMQYLCPDAKIQITLEYIKNIPYRIDTIVLSTQHDTFDNEKNMHQRIYNDIKNILIPRIKTKIPNQFIKLFNNQIKYYINPTGSFTIGGPDGDSGLTGRKIIIDTYGGKGSHGGGSFSGKDPSKMDRSASYAARYIAKNLIAAGIADEILIQISYAIGIATPINIYTNTYGTAKYGLTDHNISKKISSLFDLRPFAIETQLKLRNPIYRETAVYGHMGRTPKKINKVFFNMKNEKIELEVELFTWEKLDLIKFIKTKFI